VTCESVVVVVVIVVVVVVFVVVARHSLFPLLALLFERCEQATHAPDSAALSSLKADIQLFVQHQQQRDGKFSSDDPEVDSLVSIALYSLLCHSMHLVHPSVRHSQACNLKTKKCRRKIKFGINISQGTSEWDTWTSKTSTAI